MATSFWARGLARLPRTFVLLLVYLLSFRWLLELLELIRARLARKRRAERLRDVRRGRPLHCAPRCAVIPREIYKRADPMIYSQFYLMEQGLSVTWDNPDIQLFRKGAPVSSSSLDADTEYEVVATIYNNSTEAPAVGLLVEFAYRTFGVGATIVPIGSTHVDLPVKGAAGHPAHAAQNWHTPPTAGHYCLQVRLVWPDDANPKNNLGQENTNVGVAASPAHFRFPIRNEDTIRKHIEMTADAYTIPSPIDCRQRPRKSDSDRRYASLKRQDVFVPPTEEDADWALARVRHGLGGFPVPRGWTVEIRPPAFDLAPDAVQHVSVVITPPDDFRGERAFNINALYGAGLLGGVTLIVRK